MPCKSCRKWTLRARCGARTCSCRSRVAGSSCWTSRQRSASHHSPQGIIADPGRGKASTRHEHHRCMSHMATTPPHTQYILRTRKKRGTETQGSGETAPRPRPLEGWSNPGQELPGVSLALSDLTADLSAWPRRNWNLTAWTASRTWTWHSTPAPTTLSCPSLCRIQACQPLALCFSSARKWG